MKKKSKDHTESEEKSNSKRQVKEPRKRSNSLNLGDNDEKQEFTRSLSLSGSTKTLAKKNQERPKTPDRGNGVLSQEIKILFYIKKNNANHNCELAITDIRDITKLATDE
ncbi:MAG: hypothetical protein PV340_02160 [Wolbachia sp.]|nr:hypothetical protein [Wolbachia sp.]MDD9335952.1 hypothetical protein [Wolbachia sp.]